MKVTFIISETEIVSTKISFKTDSITKLSNFNFQQTKTMRIFKAISRGINVISFMNDSKEKILMGAQENKFQISEELRKHR